MCKISDNNQSVLVCLALVVVTFAVFYQVHSFKFVNYDDPQYVYRNPYIQQGFSLKTVKWAFTSGYASNWHPLTWLSHMLDWQLFGSDPAGHHIINLVFHIANTLLLFIVLSQMTNAFWQSAFVAALFALHPLHVESVAWVAERKDVLSTFFWMLTMFTYLQYVKHPNVIRYLLTLSTFALGLMAKPMLVTLPFVLLLLDYWPLERIPYKQTAGNRKNTEHKNRFSHRLIFYRLVLEKLPFLALSTTSSIVTFLVQKSGGAMVTGELLPLDVRIFNAFVSYVRYISKIFYPSHLAVLYPYPTAKLQIRHPLLYLLLLIGVTVITIYAVRHRRYLLVGWLWYLGILVPVIGLVQVGVQTMADRYTYLPSIGIFIMVTWGAAELFNRFHLRKMVPVSSAAIILVVLLLSTCSQLRYWRDSLTLFGHALQVTRDNYIIQNNYGIALRDKGRFDEAIIHHKQSLNIKPDNVVALNNLAWLMATQKNPEFRNPVQAVQLALRACEKTQYEKPEILDTLAVAYAAVGDFRKAIETEKKALELCQSPTQKKLKEDIKKRLALYKNGKPYTEDHP
jgi:hypothetical protein